VTFGAGTGDLYKSLGSVTQITYKVFGEKVGG